ncbi:MAG: HEPN domain-containing protein [candidate division WOR-3 bacterium]
MDKEVANWLAGAKYDLETAGSLYRSKRYIYVVFMCHMAIEKGFKALVRQTTGKTPPKIHDLIRLAEMGGVELEPETRKTLIDLNNMGVVTRYPDDLAKLSKLITKERASSVLRFTRRFIPWIEKRLK